MKNTQINKDQAKLVVITRSDLTPGYQAQQSTHSVADFAHEFPQQFKEWKTTSNSIICLQVNNEKELNDLYLKLFKLTSVTKFYEPDLNDELTSICLYADKDVRKKVSYLPLLGKKPKLTYQQVIYDMIATPQTDTQNILEHGISVAKHFDKLISGDTNNWKLPTWFTDNKEFILNNIHSLEDIKEYQVMHDCGKPYCMTIDEQGKRHFPNHTQVSFDTFSKISDNKVVADLILKDMIFHTIKSDEVEDFVKSNSIETVLTLLVTALCELHSNATMFGGIESTSFKIKFKQLDKRGKQVLDLLKNKQ